MICSEIIQFQIRMHHFTVMTKVEILLFYVAESYDQKI